MISAGSAGEMIAGSGEAAGPEDWATRLFNRSVLKQEKLRRISALLPPLEALTCLDIGGDNGVVSLLLRRRGGTWYSADLDERTVASIRELVGERVHRIDGRSTPFPDAHFDLVVIVDFLEHVETDREFVHELARILKPGGYLLVNVPHLKPRSLLNRLRHAIGLTDEKHGHVRPGYDREGLRVLLGAAFEVDVARTYSGSFSEFVDTVLNAALELRGRRSGAGRSRKGPVMTRAELARYRKEFRLLSVLYPFLWAFSRLDRLLVLQDGYKLLVRARRTHALAVANG